MRFALGASFVSSIAPLSEVEKQGCYHGADAGHYKADECKTFWERSTTDPVAFYTLGVFVFTAILGVSTIFLWDATTRAARVAERALIDLERPWIFVHLNSHLQFRPGYEQRQRRRLLDGETDPMDETPLAIFDIANHGRMPAIIDGCWVELGSVPIEWENEGGSVPQQIVLPGGMLQDQFQGAIGPGERKANLFLDCPAGLEYGVVVDMVTERSYPVPTFPFTDTFIFLIEIHYLDVAGVRHQCGYCWRFDSAVNYWVQYGGPKYNYQT